MAASIFATTLAEASVDPACVRLSGDAAGASGGAAARVSEVSNFDWPLLDAAGGCAAVSLGGGAAVSAGGSSGLAGTGTAVMAGADAAVPREAPFCRRVSV
ncbi:MAG TPA: hypothetical protein VNK23_12040 [Candidatus Dormibacteraeota bacterium]|nr:hypothetical protein [Candidatus Dormibacteraeota bacterium]